jgi:predicted acylesterase/phospholipase RssA/subtilisin family serine protease
MACNKSTQQPEPQFDPALKEILRRETGHPLGESMTEQQGQQTIPVVARLHTADAVIHQLNVVSRMGKIVTGRVALKDIIALRAHPEIISLKASRGYALDLTGSVHAIGATAQQLNQHGFAGIDGSGVVIGVADWGLDHAHEAFRHPDGSSRILAIWDQRVAPSAASPAPFGYGKLFTQQQINQSLRHSDPYRALGYDAGLSDTLAKGTHGTHVTSIAAGSGRYHGVAPNADIVFVHLRGSDTHPQDTLGDSVRLLEAVDFIFRYTGTQPTVVNLSLGNTGGAKDGSSPVELGLDALLQAQAGRAICMSSGNYYAARMHSEATLRPEHSHTLVWQVPQRRHSIAEMEIWYRQQDEFAVHLRDPAGKLTAQVALGKTALLEHNGQPIAAVYHRLQDPNNGDNQIDIFLQHDAAGGDWQVELHPVKIQNGHFHAWIERTSAAEQSRFSARQAVASSTIGTICTGKLTIACGSIDPRSATLQLGPYSSAGPSRDGRQIPLLVAPGHQILAAQSSTEDWFGQRQLNHYTVKSGTSMAAPHCSGTVALMMQAARPRQLSAKEIRDALQLSARRLAMPQSRVGCGLLDSRSAISQVSAQPVTAHTSDSSINASGIYSAEHQRRDDTMTTIRPLQRPEQILAEVLFSDNTGPRGNRQPPAHGGLAPEELQGEALALDWLFAPDEAVPREAVPPRRVTDRVRLSWQDLNQVTGSDGRPHLYYLTTGDPDQGRASFRIQLNNSTSRRARNTRIKWRLSRQQADGTYRTVPLAGQAEGQNYFIARAPDIAPNSATIRTLLVSRAILEAAYDSNLPRCRLEVEFHWYEGSTPYYNRRALSFFLFRPVEFLFGPARADGTLSLDQDSHRQDFWMRIRGKLFTERDQQPVTVSSTITTGLSQSSGVQTSRSARMTASASVTQGQSSTVGAESGASMSIGIEKIFEVGVSSSMSTSQTRSIQWSRSMATELAQQVSRNRSFSQSYSRSQTINWTIQPAAPNQVRTLYAYPVFNRKRLTIVRFGRANRFGQASSRQAIANFPLLLFSHWVDFSQITPSGRQPQGDSDEYSTATVDNTQSDAADSPQHSLITTDAEGYQAEVVPVLPKLSASAVSHLVLEGGGGKGIVFVGAIKGLEQAGAISFSANRLRGVDGVAGSSAGAITAMGLSIGMDHRAMLGLFRGPRATNFNRFFDLPANPRQIAQINRGCVDARSPSLLQSHILRPMEASIKVALDSLIPDIVERNYSQLSSSRLARNLTQRLSTDLYRYAVNSRHADRDFDDKLLSPALLYYLLNLVGDLGLFSGCFSRDFLDRLLASRNGGRRNMTFAQHRSHFGTELVITGSNLERGQTQYFSADSTPHLAVADAVRISMSLPFIYKPVRISAAQSRTITGRSTDYAGLWVDGGVWSNLPMRAFGPVTRSRGVLGIRLGVAGRVRINSFSDFLKRYLIDFGVMGSGETDEALGSSYRNRLITLPTGSIDTTQFSPPPAVANPLIERARQLARGYFSP